MIVIRFIIDETEPQGILFFDVTRGTGTGTEAVVAERVLQGALSNVRTTSNIAIHRTGDVDEKHGEISVGIVGYENPTALMDT